MEYVQPWEIWTFITFEDLESGQIKLTVSQLKRPNWMIMEWLWCYKELTADEFLAGIQTKKEDEKSEEKETLKNTSAESEKKDDKWWFFGKLKKKFK